MLFVNIQLLRSMSMQEAVEITLSFKDAPPNMYMNSLSCGQSLTSGNTNTRITTKGTVNCVHITYPTIMKWCPDRNRYVAEIYKHMTTSRSHMEKDD